MTSPPVRTALVTGAGGQLGLALQTTVPRGWRVIPCDHRHLDVTNDAQAHHVIGRERPGLVVNAAAYTAVDAAESEPERAAAVNTIGAGNVARAAREIGARLIHLSTDFVFDGCQGRPYGPNDPTNPLSVYGRTKLEGEREVTRIAEGDAVILRSAWIYGIHGRNFVLTMLLLMRERESVGVVGDQVGTPTWDRGLADAIWDIAERPDVRGVHHWTPTGVASWYDFAVAVQEEALAQGILDRAIPIRPIRTVEYPTPAARPPYGVLDKSLTWAALGQTPAHWRAQLRLMLQELSHG